MVLDKAAWPYMPGGKAAMSALDKGQLASRLLSPVVPAAPAEAAASVAEVSVPVADVTTVAAAAGAVEPAALASDAAAVLVRSNDAASTPVNDTAGMGENVKDSAPLTALLRSVPEIGVVESAFGWYSGMVVSTFRDPAGQSLLTFDFS